MGDVNRAGKGYPEVSQVANLRPMNSLKLAPSVDVISGPRTTPSDIMWISTSSGTFARPVAAAVAPAPAEIAAGDNLRN